MTKRVGDQKIIPKLPSLEAIQKPLGNLFIVNKKTNTM
jgi:hypothetical protein